MSSNKKSLLNKTSNKNHEKSTKAFGKFVNFQTTIKTLKNAYIKAIDFSRSFDLKTLFENIFIQNL